jgi:hypothetical protein
VSLDRRRSERWSSTIDLSPFGLFYVP